MTSTGVRVLGPADVPDFLALVDQDPVVNVFVSYRARTTQLDRRWLGGEMLGRFVNGELVAALHVGANLVPVQAGPADLADFAQHLRNRSHTWATLVGPHQAVDGLWALLQDDFEPPREERWRQPHLEITGAPLIAPDPDVRRSTPADMPHLYPACVAMYTEEVGISPEVGGAGPLYRARVNQLVTRGWSFARFDDDGSLLFKAEVASVTPQAAQIQGVYVAPHARGQGLGAAGMAAVVDLVRADIAPTVSLYVNEWNQAARAAYAKTGFVETARFSTVMF
jgi:ribosomal protein S18 acetylase RimI-like enzyme